MKKVFRLIGFSLLGILALALPGVGTVFWKSETKARRIVDTSAHLLALGVTPLTNTNDERKR